MTINNLPSAALIEAVAFAKLGKVYAVDHLSSRGGDAKWPLFGLGHRLSLLLGRTFFAFAWMRLIYPARKIQAAFFGSILHIVRLGAQEQMVRSHTEWGIAGMKDKKPSIKSPISHSIRYAMRAFATAIEIGRSVSRIVRFSTPKPACFGLFDVLQKGLGKHNNNLSLPSGRYNYVILG